jgi:hypothetical protein
MHVLDHPHLPRAMTVAVIAALLAIVLTLALATGLNDLRSAPAATTVTRPAHHAPASSRAWALSPFTRVFAPVVVPWAPTRP